MFCPKCGVQNLDTSRFCKKCGKPLPNRAQVHTAAGQNYLAPNLVGQTLDGKYRIDGKLGSGGMGDVYRATRLLIGDTVAVKLLHTHLARNPQAAERFRHEAVTATKLRHRNVVALYDVGISAVHNVPYILMEFAEGLTLRQIMNQGVLPLDFAVTVIAQVCAALEEAHRLGIVHRDIKPENIIANQTANGWHVKVLDFGIAKLYNEASSGLTQDGTAMGTPQYMSPEQCMGEPLDMRSDLYSVGIVVYEMLCGTVPFKSAVASAVAVYQVQTAPPPPSAINQDITPEVEAVILRALSKQPEMRQQNSQTLAQEFIQAATIAFKSGNFTASKVAAPPAEEPEVISPPIPDNLSGEKAADENAVEISAPEEDPSDEAVPSGAMPAETSGEEKTKKTAKGRKRSRQRKKNSEDEAIEKPKNYESISVDDKTVELTPETGKGESIIDPDNKADSKPLENTLSQEDLSLVFEDAESRLDELFPDEKRQREQTSQPTPIDASEINDKQENFEANQPIFTPEETPSQILPEEGTENDPGQEITSGPKNKNFAIIIAVSGSLVIAFIGIIILGWWLLSGEKTPIATANTSTESTLNSSEPPIRMAYIPGGGFMLGTDSSIDDKKMDTPAHSVSVQPFFIDLTEVTNEDYKKFVDATNHKTPSRWKNGTFPGGKNKFPVTGVDWDDANAYAKWMGKRLPTEEEWEFAARGNDGRTFPWGNDWNKEFANADKQRQEMREVQKSAGKSPFGLFDMSGNAWEWTATDAKAYINGNEFENTLVEPKIIRGGFFGSSKERATTTVRRAYGARGEKDGYDNTGFRCVRDISQN
jgi:serine/threonine protein kinase